MQYIKIGIFLILLVGVIYFVVKDHKDSNTTNAVYITNTKNTTNIDKFVSDTKITSTNQSTCGGENTCSIYGEPEHGAESSDNINGEGCSSCSVPGAKTKLLPVMDPLYNMREICKQSILLEDHLFQKKKRCKDCCIKHQLTIEALAEEAITLDKDGKCKDLYDLPDKIRDLQKDFIAGKDPSLIAQDYRKIRKSLMQRCFHNF